MRPQGFGQGGASLEDLGWNDMGFEPPKPAEMPAPDAALDAFVDEISEHHHHVHPTGLTPVQSPVHTQQSEIADRLGVEESEEEFDETAEPCEEEPAPVAIIPAPKPAPAPVVRRAPTSRAAPGSKGKAAFTLRLDPQRHLKLRLACAVNGRSAQQIVTDALDQLLTEMPELEPMAEKARLKG